MNAPGGLGRVSADFQTALDETMVVGEVARRLRAGQTPSGELLDQLDLAAAQIRVYLGRAHREVADLAALLKEAA